MVTKGAAAVDAKANQKRTGKREQRPSSDFKRTIARSAFVLAFFGWGVGFYGPSIYLAAVTERTGWPLASASFAVTLHFVSGVLVVWNLPRIFSYWGVPTTIAVGALVTGTGVFGWATAQTPWQLYAAAVISGLGWVTMGAVTVNAIVSPWFERNRAGALATAYNGGTVGGVLFSPLWVTLIAWLGFSNAALGVGVLMLATMLVLGRYVFGRRPSLLGDERVNPAVAPAPPIPSRPGKELWKSRAFKLLAVGAAIGLFAQIGLFAHLFLLLKPAIGAQSAGLVMGGSAAFAILGRTVAARLIKSGVETRSIAGASYTIQAVGSMALALAAPGDTALILVGAALIGSGLGNTSYLPPMIAHSDFAPNDVPRVVSMVVALGQGTYSFAPLVFGAFLTSVGVTTSAGIGAHTVVFFAMVSCVQLVAAACFFAHPTRSSRIGAH